MRSQSRGVHVINLWSNESRVCAHRVDARDCLSANQNCRSSHTKLSQNLKSRRNLTLKADRGANFAQHGVQNFVVHASFIEIISASQQLSKNSSIFPLPSFVNRDSFISELQISILLGTFCRQYTTMSCLNIFAQHGYKVPNKSHLPNSWTIMSFCWAKTTHMLGKYSPYVGQNRKIQPVHVGQILPTCWANTTHMLGKYCPHVGQIPPSVGHYGVSCCAQEASFHSQLQDS